MDINRQTTSTRTHILSVDVEDYFMVEAFAGSVQRSSWDSRPSRVVANTQRLLDLFDRHEAKATFFFLGCVADRFPDLVRQVASRGHELACHSYWHRTVYSLTPDEFREDTRVAVQAIQNASGVRVTGYRAPTWSITKNCLWALDILADEGFVYDSSIYPIHHDLYGVPGAQRFPYKHICQGGRTLLEYPPATISRAGVTLPAAGGGYLRIFPLFVTQRTFRDFEEKHHQPVVVYLHPWEVDPQQPRIQAKLRSRFRHYTNLHKMERRLTVLLESHRFQSFQDLIERESARAARIETLHAISTSLAAAPGDAKAARLTAHQGASQADAGPMSQEQSHACADRVARAPVLTYHAIGLESTSSPYTLTCQQFDQHLEVLGAAKRLNADASSRTSITFDDGHGSNYEYALPLLQRHSLRATFFVVASYMNSRPGFMTWAQLREMAALGHDIQSHSWSHPYLTHCSEEELRKELERSRETIEQHLGTPVDALGVPGGRWDERVLRAAASAGYRRVYVSDPWITSQGKAGVELIGRFTMKNNIDAATLRGLVSGQGMSFTLFRTQYKAKEMFRRAVGDGAYRRLWSLLATPKALRTDYVAGNAAEKGTEAK